jgi:hypothetical protein
MATELFHFTHDSKKYTIPKFSNLSAGTLRKSRKGEGELDKAFIILELTLGEDSKELAAVDSMTVEVFGDFLKAWTDGASVGESSGS